MKIFVIDEPFVNYLSSFVNELFKIIFEVFTDLPTRINFLCNFEIIASGYLTSVGVT